jgi:hypothetical protein
MANVEQTLKDIATKVASYVENAAELRVETRYRTVGEAGRQALDLAADTPAAALVRIRSESELLAASILQLDGDSVLVLPMQKTGDAGTLTLDAELLAAHERNVLAAQEYRARILSSLIGLFQGRRL